MSFKSKRTRNPLRMLIDLRDEFPAQFWILILGTFIDRLGGAMMFPFFTLYLTKKFGIGMTEVGGIFALFALSSLVGSMFGGALADRLGRKGMLLFGLVMSAVSSILMGVINDLNLFLGVTLFVGLLSNAGGPAQQAMVADLLPEEKRAEGFGILRVVANLSVTIGPVIGGLLAARSYLLLFLSDAVTSLITALIVFLVIKETYQAVAAGEKGESLLNTFRGYLDVRRDTAFIWYLGASMLMVLVYMQMNTTLSVYLRDLHGIDERGFGYILSLNAGMVVLFQFSVTRWVKQYRPLMVMGAGTFLYAIGFAMYGFVTTFLFFLVAMVIITIGEMMVSPVGQAIVAKLAPEDMRGRYMAVYGFSWVIPSAVGPVLAGIVMDDFSPFWVWYMAGIIGLVAAGAFYYIESRIGRARWGAIDQRLAILESVEEGRLSAVEGGHLLEKVEEGYWTRLGPDQEPRRARKLHIRVSDLASGVMKSDLVIPVGLVDAALHGGGHLTSDLDEEREQVIRHLISLSQKENRPQQMQTGDDHLEVELDE